MLPITSTSKVSTTGGYKLAKDLKVGDKVLTVDLHESTYLMDTIKEISKLEDKVSQWNKLEYEDKEVATIYYDRGRPPYLGESTLVSMNEYNKPLIAYSIVLDNYDHIVIDNHLVELGNMNLEEEEGTNE